MQAVATPDAPPLLSGRSTRFTYNRSPRPLPPTPNIENQSFTRSAEAPEGLV